MSGNIIEAENAGEFKGKVTQKVLETALDESFNQLLEHIKSNPGDFQTVLSALCIALDPKKYIKPASREDKEMVYNELLNRNLIQKKKVLALRACAEKIASENNLAFPSLLKVNDAMIPWFKEKMPLIQEKYPINQ